MGDLFDTTAFYWLMIFLTDTMEIVPLLESWMSTNNLIIHLKTSRLCSVFLNNLSLSIWIMENETQDWFNSLINVLFVLGTLHYKYRLSSDYNHLCNCVSQ